MFFNAIRLLACIVVMAALLFVASVAERRAAFRDPPHH
jgi:hypothetical protein